MPLQHIGMNGGRATGQTEVGRADAVALQVSRTVGRSHHVAKLANGRTHIVLPEFDEDIGFDGLQTPAHFLHEYVNGMRYGLDVSTLVILCYGRVNALNQEAVNEIEFETIDIPLP